MRLACVCLLAASCVGPRSHAQPVGPVTAIVASRGQVWSCAQNGVFAGAGAELRPFCAPPFRPIALAALADGGLLVAGGEPARSGSLARYGADGSLAGRVAVASDLVYALACDEQVVALGCADGRVLLHGLPGLEPIRTVHVHAGPVRAVLLVRLATAGTLVVSAGRDGRILLTPSLGGPTRSLVDHTAGVECLAFEVHDARTLLYSGALDGKVRLHDLGSAPPRLVRTWNRLGATVCALLPGPIVGLGDGKLLARSVSDDLAAVTQAAHALTAIAVTERGQLALGGNGAVTLLPLAGER